MSYPQGTQNYRIVAANAGVTNPNTIDLLTRAMNPLPPPLRQTEIMNQSSAVGSSGNIPAGVGEVVPAGYAAHMPRHFMQDASIDQNLNLKSKNIERSADPSKLDAPKAVAGGPASTSFELRTPVNIEGSDNIVHHAPITLTFLENMVKTAATLDKNDRDDNDSMDKKESKDKAYSAQGPSSTPALVQSKTKSQKSSSIQGIRITCNYAVHINGNRNFVGLPDKSQPCTDKTGSPESKTIEPKVDEEGTKKHVYHELDEDDVLLPGETGRAENGGVKLFASHDQGMKKGSNEQKNKQAHRIGGKQGKTRNVWGEYE